MLVYDITSERSFDNIKNWIRNIEEVRHIVACLYNYVFQSAAEFLWIHCGISYCAYFCNFKHTVTYYIL